MAYSNIGDLLEAARRDGSIARAALAREAYETDEDAADLRERMRAYLGVMREAVAEGLRGTARSRSGLVGGDARRLSEGPGPLVGGVFSRALASAIAVAEVNASMGRIVASPTGGASGIVPGVLLALAEERGLDDEALVDALFTSAAVGGVIASRTSLSGAAAGCQAEIGAASAMAAAAAVEACGGSAEAALHAASFALQGALGLVCDPIGGLVEVPCVARNATGTAMALAGAEMALAGLTFPVPFDEVAEALASIGRALPHTLRETALGGLAATPSGRRLAPTEGPER